MESAIAGGFANRVEVVDRSPADVREWIAPFRRIVRFPGNSENFSKDKARFPSRG